MINQNTMGQKSEGKRNFPFGGPVILLAWFIIFVVVVLWFIIFLWVKCWLHDGSYKTHQIRGGLWWQGLMLCSPVSTFGGKRIPVPKCLWGWKRQQGLALGEEFLAHQMGWLMRHPVLSSNDRVDSYQKLHILPPEGCFKSRLTKIPLDHH